VNHDSSFRPAGGHPQTPARTMVVVVTGLSGAGKTTALHALEDLGFFCVDNLPTALAPQSVELCERGGMMRIALGMDVRVRAFLKDVESVVGKLENGGFRDVQLVFLDASDETILRRFSETRRPHPLSTGDGALGVVDGARIERERLAPLRARATRIFDTTRLSVHELRRAIIAHFGPASGGAPRMVTRVVSFGFKYGPPVDADLVFDVRFLDNPYFVPRLKSLPGTDPAVVQYVLSLPECKTFLAKIIDLLEFVLPRYEREGKSYLTIGVGCTGGRHRSVVIADAIASALSQKALASNRDSITAVHRDVDRSAGGPEGGRDSAPDLAATGDHRTSEVELKGASAPPPAPSQTGGSLGGHPQIPGPPAAPRGSR
jgi:UPF0042 nucleotide-binding protein